MRKRPAAPRQERSRKTLERIVLAARDVFAEQGEVGFTIPEVSRRAGTSIPTIYSRFATKEDLLRTVFTRFVREESDEAMAGWAEIDWSQMDRQAMIDRLIADLSRPWRMQPELARALMARRLESPDEDGGLERGVAFVRKQADGFRAAILTHRGEISHADPDQAIDFAYRLIVAACARWTARAVETLAPEPMSWEEMFSHLGEVISAYVFD